MPADTYDFSGLKAVYLNCTLKRSPEPSNTQGLMDVSRRIMERHGVTAEVIRAVDFEIAPGVYPDMREHGWESDAWPEVWARVREADILVLGTPIWLGDKSSVCTKVIERLYGHSAETNAEGFTLEQGVNFLQKPYQLGMLVRVVRQAVERGPST